jgi:uncharacterized protein
MKFLKNLNNINMKKLALFLFLFVTFLSVKSQSLLDALGDVKPTGYVNDFQNLFTPEQKDTLEKMMSDYEKKTSIEFCLVTYYIDPDYYTENDVSRLSEKWGVGKKELNNGFMMFLSFSNEKGKSNYFNATGYGLESVLPDGLLSNIESKIFPNQASSKEDVELFTSNIYNAYKKYIKTCQDEIGYEGYDMLAKQKEIKDEKEKAETKAFFGNLFRILLLLLFLSGVGYLIYLQYKKRQQFLELKRKINMLLLNIENLRDKFDTLPEEIQIIYNTKIDKLTNKLVNDDTYNNLNYIYNILLDYRQTINNINSSLETIKNYKSDIQKYLNQNYPYCDKYLKNELNKIIPDSKINELESGEYSKKRMNMLKGVATTLDNKLNIFLNKTVKIKNILSDKQNFNNKIDDLKKSYSDYIKKKTILSTVKIGNRYNSLVNVDFDNKLLLLNTYITDSFNYLENSDYDQAVTSYGNYITTLSVINSSFSAVDNLYNEYNRSVEYLKNKKYDLRNSISDIDNKINNSGVSYSRKSTYDSLKSDISRCKREEDYDVILAAASLNTILINLDGVYSSINSDISSYNYSQQSTYYSPSPSTTNSDFGGFGGGSFGGGGSGGSF